MNVALRWLLALSLVAGWIGLLAPSDASAACTKGTDCYADCVRGPATVGAFKNAACAALRGGAGIPVDTTFMFAEDFDHPCLNTNCTTTGSGGPPYAADGIPINNRGGNWWWTRTYPNGRDTVLWAHLGQPSSPTFGAQCNVPGFSFCTGVVPWIAGDSWNGNAINSCVQFPRTASDYSAERGSVTAPTNTVSGAAGIFEGNGSMSPRIPPNNHCDILGDIPWVGGTARTFSISEAFGFPSDSSSSTVWTASWKFDEFTSIENPAADGSGLFMFHNDAARSDQDPFKHFIFLRNGTGISNCQAAIDAATIRLGTLDCVTTAIYYRPRYSGYTGQGQGGTPRHGGPADIYLRSRDWPDGTWQCVRGSFQGFGTGTTTIKIWFNNTLIIDFDFNDDTFNSRQGYGAMVWDPYANTNQANSGGTPTSSATWRYQDNIHVTRSATPISCAQIGFGGGGGGPINTSISPSTATTTIASTTAIARIFGTVVSPRAAVRNALEGAWTASILIMTVIVVAVTIRTRRGVKR